MNKDEKKTKRSELELWITIIWNVFYALLLVFTLGRDRGFKKGLAEGKAQQIGETPITPGK